MVDKKYIIDEDVADNVRAIFSLYLSGMPMQDITNELTRTGVMNVNGKPFSFQHVSKILHNKRYAGIFTYKGEEYEDYLPAIIDSDTFERTQDRLGSYKNVGKRKSDAVFHLTGKLFCGHCGRSMGGASSTSRTNKKRHYYYKCRTGDKKTEKKNELEELVVSIVLQTILRAEYLDELVDCIMASSDTHTQGAAKRNDRIKRAIRSNNRKIANLLDAVKQGIVSSSLQNELESLENNNEKLRMEISANNAIYARPLDREKVTDFFRRLASRHQTRDRQVSAVIKVFVKRVTVWDDGDITIETHLPNERITLKRDEYNEKMVRLNSTKLHHSSLKTHPIGFTTPEIYVYNRSIYVCAKRKL